jgi:dihydropteroate synthase
MTLARPVDASARDENGAAHPLARLLALGRPAVMGVLNVTPDSFSDGGRFLDPTIAIEQAERMVAGGADVVDVGAESTRPYGSAVLVPIDEEIRRLTPVLPGAVALGVPVSIDTMKAKVAAWALANRPSNAPRAWTRKR